MGLENPMLRKAKKKADKRTTRSSKALKKRDKTLTALKKKSKRNKVKNASLNPKYHNLSVHEYLDYDYLSSLTDKEKEFLNKFTEEHYRAYFNKDVKKHLHKKKERKSVYNANNARNRCIISRSKKEQNLYYVDTQKAKNLTTLDKASHRDIEDALITYLDSKSSLEGEES
jgi:hypothetical protein